MRKLMVVAVLVVAVAGCGTMGNRLTVQDDDNVAYVNAVARERGAQVYWFHPPQKRVDEKADQTVPQKTTP